MAKGKSRGTDIKNEAVGASPSKEENTPLLSKLTEGDMEDVG